jgi:hypothetical protein
MTVKSFKVEDVIVVFDNKCPDCLKENLSDEIPFATLFSDDSSNHQLCENCGARLSVSKLKCNRTNHSGYSQEEIDSIAHSIFNRIHTSMDDVMYDAIVDDLYYDDDIPNTKKHFNLN